MERMRPEELDRAVAECPVLFQPLGTIEWHGLQNIVGLDAVKAHHLCVSAARLGGGVVAPPLFGGVGGLDEPFTFVMEPEDRTDSVLLRPWVERLCAEAVRNGFKGVILLTGHYGAGQQIVVRDLAVRASRTLGVPVLGTPEYILALDEGYLGDHAAWGETSLMLHLDPCSVDLSRLGQAPHQGVFGRDPLEATAEDGERIASVIVDRLAAVARSMPTWDSSALRAFQDAEAAIVNRQLELAVAEGVVWGGWRNIQRGALKDYGKLLAEGEFEALGRLADEL
jgi:creatinine amidohydrolase